MRGVVSSVGWVAMSVLGALGCSQAPNEATEAVGTARAALSAVQSAKLGAYDAWHGDGFGNAVAFSAGRLLVGSSNDDLVGSGRDEGSAFLFERSGADWGVPRKLTATIRSVGDHFGSAVAIAGDVLAVGASGHFGAIGANQGEVFVFRRSGTTWLQTQTLVAATGQAEEQFGSSVALDGTTLVAGARAAVRVFSSSSGVFSEQQEIRPPFGTGEQRVALSGDLLVIGSPLATSTSTEQGAINVYRRAGTAFVHESTHFAGDAHSQDHFGNALAVSEDTILVGTNPTDASTERYGAAYVFVAAASGFAQQAKLEVGTDRNALDQFGYSVALDGDLAAISAPFHEHGGVNLNHGSLYLFERTGSVWSETSEIFPDDANNNDHFGSAVALGPELVFAGSPNDDVPFSAMGSAYVFELSDVGSGGTGGSSGSGGTGGDGGTGGNGGTGGSGEPEACVRVAPDGDNDAALASNGATPFRDLQPAIDFASGHRDIATRVCVAAGSSCEAVAEYTEFPLGRLTMRDGISVFGKYESTDWTRCPNLDAAAVIAAAATPGIEFGPEITTPTTLDGFVIRAQDPNSETLISVDGARGAQLVDLDVPQREGFFVPGGSLRSRAIYVGLDSVATVTRCRVAAPPSQETFISVEIDGGEATIEDSILSAFGDDTIAISAREPHTLRIARNSITSTGAYGRPSGIQVSTTGSPGPIIEDNDIQVTAFQGHDAVGVDVFPSAAQRTPATVARNRISFSTRGYSLGIRATGGDAELLENVITTGEAQQSRAHGIVCDDCAEVSGNDVEVCSVPGGCFPEGIGAIVYGTGTLVDSNSFDGGCAESPHGLVVAGDVLVQNNVLTAGSCFPSRIRKSSGITVVEHPVHTGSVEIRSNFMDPGGDTFCTSSGLELVGERAPAIVRNNIILPGICNQSFNVDQTKPLAYPAVFENNDLVPGAFGLYRIQGYTDPRTIEAVNNQPGHDGNFSAECGFPLESLSPCMDAGTPAGAPDHDYEGDARDDGMPDVGPDERDTGLPNCEDDPCLHGGVCTVLPGGGPACSCPPSFTGERCEIAFTKLATGPTHACGLRTDGSIACWGGNQLGQTNVTPGTYLDVSAGGYHSCGIRADTRDVTCWGSSSEGQTSPPPAAFLSIASGSFHTCGIATDHTLRCWGLTGTGNPLVPPMGTFDFVGTSDDGRVCAIRTGGTIECFGEPITGDNSPPPAGNYRVAANALFENCAISNDGQLDCWGYDFRMAFPPEGSFRALGLGWQTGCAVRDDGTLACWGENDSGQATPPSGTFKAVSVNFQYACGIRSDDAVTCWGDNSFGQLNVP